LDYNEFKCKWIDPVYLWNIADETRNKYWPESRLPVNTEEIVEFRLRLNIEPVKYLLSTIDIDAYLKRDLLGIVVDYDCYRLGRRPASRLLYGTSGGPVVFPVMRRLIIGFADDRAFDRLNQNRLSQ